MRRVKRDPLIIDVIAAVCDGQVTIGPIHAKGMEVHGLWQPGSIRINPNIAFVDTAIHEALHRLNPDWTEQYVKARTSKIMKQLSDEEIDRLYEVVNQKAYKTKRAKRLDTKLIRRSR